jgi:hypothetical protein
MFSQKSEDFVFESTTSMFYTLYLYFSPYVKGEKYIKLSYFLTNFNE